MLRSGPANNTSSPLLQIAVAGSFVFFAVPIGLVLFQFFGFGLFGAFVAGGLLSMMPSGFLGRYLARKEAQEEEFVQRKIRADQEAEKQKQIDAMQRKASNVPNVKRGTP